MKVIGVGNDKYICEVEYDEMYELIGMDEEEFDVNAGDDIPLVRAVRAANWVRDLDQEHIERIVKELTRTLEGVKRVQDTAVKLNLFNRLKEQA